MNTSKGCWISRSRTKRIPFLARLPTRHRRHVLLNTGQCINSETGDIWIDKVEMHELRLRMYQCGVVQNIGVGLLTLR